MGYALNPHALRERRASLNLTREELAARTGVSVPTIKRAERGRALSAYTRRRLCEGLECSSAELGLMHRWSPRQRQTSQRRCHEDDPMRRREFLAERLPAAGVTVAGVFLREGRDVDRMADTAQLLTDVTRSYRLLEATTPSRHLVAAVESHFAVARQHAARWADDRPVPGRVYAAISEIASLAAWLYADLGDRHAAREHYRLAIRFAERSGHRLLRSYQIGSLGQFAAECGDTGPALALLDRARQQLPEDGPGTAKVWLSSIEAVARATAQDEHGAWAALDTAERLVSLGSRSAPPAWPLVSVYDYAKVSAYRVSCASRLGDAGVAEGAFATARAALRSPKPYARALIDLAQAFARRREIGEACRLATEALTIAEAFGSENVAQKVARFRNSLGAIRSAETAELDDRLSAAYL